MSVAPSNPKGMHMSTKIKHAITTPDAPQPAGPYSQGIVSGDLLFTAGFGPQDPATGEVAESVAEQTRQGLRTLQAVPAERGAPRDDALQTTAHLADLADSQELNEAHREPLPGPGPAAAHTAPA